LVGCIEGDVTIGGDGTRGSASYWAIWDTEVLSPNKESERIMEDAMQDAIVKVMQHTLEGVRGGEAMFEQACGSSIIQKRTDLGNVHVLYKIRVELQPPLPG